MNKLIIFVVETKSEKLNSDGVYLRETLNHFYGQDRSRNTQFVFMDGKGNYNKKKVTDKIKGYINDSKKVDANTPYYVYYVLDKDDSDTSSEAVTFNQNVVNYCKEKGYQIIWMNRNVEEVYWNKSIQQNQKVKEAGKFRNKNEISKVDVTRLSKAKASSRHTSNILVELDKILERKQ